MKKSSLLWISAMLMIVIGMSSCSSDDEGNVVYVEEGNVVYEEEENVVYEDNPTTLEGTWHLVKAFFSFGGFHEVLAGDVAVDFYPNHTMQVINKSDTQERDLFITPGVYSYEIVSNQTNKYDGTVYTTINLDVVGSCTYWIKDGMLVLDFGMAFDAPGYYFKKVHK